MLPTHVLSVFQKIVFCLKKLNLTAVMIQQIVPWVGSLLALLGISRQADGAAANLQASESKNACCTRREDTRMYADM